MTNKKLMAHSSEFHKGLVKITDGVYVAVGFTASNSIMIEGNKGLIINTTESTTAARNVLAAFRDISEKPIKAIFLTHSHRDHVSGAAVFAVINKFHLDL